MASRPRTSTGVDGPASSSGAATVVEHGANLAEGVADNVALVEVEGSVLDEDGGYSAAAAVELGFKDAADGLASGRSLGRLDVADQADHFEKQIEVDAFLRGNFDEDRAFAAGGPFFGDESAIGELLLHALRVGFGLVDLVDGHDDGNFGGLGVIDGFQSLRHDAVVCGHHDDHNVGDLGAAGAHASEGFVARRIEEHNFST